MAYQLIALSGPRKGASWPIDKEGIVLGSAPDCNVVIHDQEVSRRHCALTADTDHVVFKDLGGLTPALINGAIAASECAVRSGDELGLGHSLFLVADAGARCGHGDGVFGDPDSYLCLEHDQWVALEADTRDLLAHNRPRTFEDLVTLHTAGQAFSGANTITELARAVHQTLRQRYVTSATWVGRVTDGDIVNLDGLPLSTEPPPEFIIRQALEHGRPRMKASTPMREGGEMRTLTVACPALHGERTVAVLAVEFERPYGVYHPADLAFLMLLGRTLAPILEAVEGLEMLERDNERLRVQTNQARLVGSSRAMSRIRAQIRRVAGLRLNVLITGETGTGKEVAARMLHALSPRYSAPLVIVNCAAIPRDLFESTIFGYERGAFTGALQASPGLMAQADRGTLFLDEVGDLSLENQARILRVVEMGTFVRIGATSETSLDVRIIAATNRSLAPNGRRNSFREDLYHRIAGYEIHMPSLRERRSDIHVLALHFLGSGVAPSGQTLRGISDEALQYLSSLPWPGNVRELRNCILRAVGLAVNDTITLDDVRKATVPTADESIGENEIPSLAVVERRHIESVLHQCHGNIIQAAKYLQIARSTLYDKLATYRIER